MAYIVIVIARVGLACIGMVYILMAYILLAYIVSAFPPKLLIEGFRQKSKEFLINFTFRHKSKAKKERFAKNMRHPKILPPLVFRKRANHKSRNAQPQSEREPQNEARFADCAIFGEGRLVINAEVALAFFGKTSV